MKKAVEQVVGPQIAMITGLAKLVPGAKAAAFNGFSSFKKHGCAEAQGQPGYVCDFSFELTMGQEHMKNSGKGRFFKIDSGWGFEERS